MGLEGPGGGLVAAVFDPHRTYRAYGYTEGELIIQNQAGRRICARTSRWTAFLKRSLDGR
jgi:glutamate synthase domain-containing protein 3